ncbi:MAG TPA: CAP domain-containing protein [Burkholderiales bacterium]|nr:CAP domain-containing protein [Burkholderiales bacterium]
MTSTRYRRHATLFAFLCLAYALVAKESIAVPGPAKIERVIVGATNDFRRTQKQPKLETDPALAQTALNFARFMAKTGNYGHNADGRSPEQRAQQQGYDYCIVAENIAYISTRQPIEADALALRFVHGWQNSPDHRKNMLNSDVTQIGVAVARSDKTGYFYAVQLLGRPKRDAISFQIDNRSNDTISYMLGDRALSLPPGTIRTHRQCGRSELKLGVASVIPQRNERYAVIKDGPGKFRLVMAGDPSRTSSRKSNKLP